MPLNNGAGVGDVFTLGRGGADLLFDRLNLIPFRLDIDRVERLEVNGLDGDDRFTFTGLGGGSSLQGVRFDGGTGDDVLDASTADRFVFGKGGDGRDVLEGGIADDLLQGGAGDDRLDGGAGRDLLHGGAGADTFSLFTADGGRDVIDDFELGTDVLEVRGLTPFYRPGVSDPNDFLQFTDAGGSTTIAFDLPGGGPFLDLVTLRGVSGVTFETLDAAGSILIV